jgi:hypothetical protein
MAPYWSFLAMAQEPTVGLPKSCAILSAQLKDEINDCGIYKNKQKGSGRHLGLTWSAFLTECLATRMPA